MHTQYRWWSVLSEIELQKCEDIYKCQISEQSGDLKSELTREILKKAAVYASETKKKEFRPYEMTTHDNRSN